MKVPFDPPERTFQHIAHLARLQMSKAREDEVAALLVPGAISCNRMEMRVETQIGRRSLYRGDSPGLRTHGARLRRSADVKRLDRIHEDLSEPAQQLAVLGEPWPPREREGQHPLPQPG